MYQSVLVTGASSGIGETCAVHLAREGFRVFAAGRRIEKLRDLEGLAQGRITALEMDITDNHSVQSAIAQIARSGASLYGLVNNAGVSVMGPVESVALKEWTRQFETNVFGLVRVTQAVLPTMREAGKGRIVNIGSIADRIAPPFQGVYASSKHAVEGLSDSLRREVAPFGIHVSLVRPGFINTPFGQQEQESLEAYIRSDNPYAEAIAKFKHWHARGHPGGPGPSVVAEAVCAALTAERPRSRYTAPKRNLGLLAARNLLPSAVADRLMNRIIGLK